MKFDVIAHLVFLFSVCVGVGKTGLKYVSVVGSEKGILCISDC